MKRAAGVVVPIPTVPTESTIVMMALFAALSSLPSVFLALPMWSFHPVPCPGSGDRPHLAWRLPPETTPSPAIASPDLQRPLGLLVPDDERPEHPDVGRSARAHHHLRTDRQAPHVPGPEDAGRAVHDQIGWRLLGAEDDAIRRSPPAASRRPPCLPLSSK